MALELGPLESWAREELDRKNAVREQALRLSREMIRHCANSIRAVHRREFDLARELSAQAMAIHRQIQESAGEIGEVYWAGYVQDAQKELVEALCTYALVNQQPLPDPLELHVSSAPYLNGLAEAVGELRRYTLDSLRRGELDGTERLLAAMDDIYSLLVSVDYPDAITGGLRRSTDNARGILEKTRGDLTLALRQEALQRALAAANLARL